MKGAPREKIVSQREETVLSHWSNNTQIQFMGEQGYTPGDIGWSELNTTDTQSAVDFYCGLLGWEHKGEPMPGYHVFGRGEESLGGIQRVPDTDTAPHWVPYVTVADLDATLAKLEGLGGKQLGPVMPLPDGSRIALIQDPQGVTTGLAQYPPKS